MPIGRPGNGVDALRVAEHHVGPIHLLSAAPLGQERVLRYAYANRVRWVLQEAQGAGLLRADIHVKYLCLSLLGLMNRVEIWYRPSGPLSARALGELLGAIFLTGAAARPGV